MSRPNAQEEIDVIVLSAKIGTLTQGVPDAIVLTALLSLYAAIAKNNRCRTYGAVNALLDVAEDIAGTQAAGMEIDVQSPRTETILVH
jgi:hypothetical protein